MGAIVPIPIMKPLLDDEEAVACRKVIESGWVTQGPRVKDFETEFAAYVGSSYACAVSNCTTALHLALLVVGVEAGDAVITVSHSFIATANAVRACFAEPLFVDIEPSTFTMDPQSLEDFLGTQCELRDGELFVKASERYAVGQSPWRRLMELSPHVAPRLGRIKAIVVVHQMGFPCDIVAISDIAKRYSIPIIEDAACALGTQWRVSAESTWNRIGSPIGAVVCFSFHPRKLVTTGDGGMLTYNDPAFDTPFRQLRQHGMTLNDLTRHQSRTVVIESYAVSAFNYRLTDIQAAVGSAQLAKLDRQIADRQALVGEYRQLLLRIPWASLTEADPNTFVNWQSLPLKLLPTAPCSALQLLQHLADHGITGRLGIMNAHSEICYQAQDWKLPVSEAAREHTILLPLFSGMVRAELERVVDCLASFTPDGPRPVSPSEITTNE